MFHTKVGWDLLISAPLLAVWSKVATGEVNVWTVEPLM